MTDSDRLTVDLDRSKLLGFDQESGGRNLPAAKIGPKDSPASAPGMPNAARVGIKRLNPCSVAALSAKIGTKTFITTVETASGFRSTADDLGSDRPSMALIFSTVDAPSIGLDWSHLLGFDQADRPTAMVGEKDNSPALRAKVGSKDPGRPA
ncbi:MAG: hypothetical protein WD044_13075 [Dongiaceae bacterium]